MRTSCVAVSVLGVVALSFIGSHGQGAEPLGTGAAAAAPAQTFVRPATVPRLAPRFVVEETSERATTFTPVPKRVSAAQSPVANQLPASVVSTCAVDGLKFRWPLDDAAGTAWVINNFTDVDPTGGKKDFLNASGDAALTYDGHQGYDIDVGSFREMDQNKDIVRAAAEGDVVAIDQSHEDRHTSCVNGDWNYVAIKHANGFVSYYGHLKKSSVKVRLGAHVPEGQELGIVGSSGCSTTPHLHFEVQDCENRWLEPASRGMWKSPPQGGEVSGVLDVMIRSGDAINWELKDPAPNLTTTYKGRELGIGLSAATRAGDEITIGVYSPGTPPNVWSWAPPGRYGHRFAAWPVFVGNQPGLVSIVVWVNLKQVDTRTVTILP